MQPHGTIAGGVAGLGAGEVARRVLGAQEVSALIEREISERRAAAATYDSHGRASEAIALRA
ncbi:MAG TPA: glutamyl-tRNA amidotransferase, partial [Polyangia bacterium]